MGDGTGKRRYFHIHQAVSQQLKRTMQEDLVIAALNAKKTFVPEKKKGDIKPKNYVT